MGKDQGKGREVGPGVDLASAVEGDIMVPQHNHRMASSALSAQIAILQAQWDLTSPDFAQAFAEEFKAQMRRGLRSQRPSSLAMIEAFIPKTAAFKPGTYMGLDLSGTNFRVVLLSIDGDQRVEREPSIAVFRIPAGLKQPSGATVATSAALFDFVASQIKIFLKNEGEFGRDIRVGFTFAFPTRMTGVSSGLLMKWTKTWDVPDLVGSDPVEALEAALEKVGLAQLKVNVLLNDTVGTLVLGYFENRNTLAGGILGTGTNFAAWLGEMAFNFECGNFDFGSLDREIRTAVDRELDVESQSPGEQLLEKMVSGRYLGELMRRLMRPHFEALSLQTPDSIVSDDLSDLLADSGDFPATGAFFNRLGVQSTELEDCRLARSIAAVLMRRSAQISALVVFALLEYVDSALEREHVITIDGSLFEHAPGYPETMKSLLERLLGGRAPRVQLKLVKDGSGIGAALSSAAVEASNTSF